MAQFALLATPYLFEVYPASALFQIPDNFLTALRPQNFWFPPDEVVLPHIFHTGIEAMVESMPIRIQRWHGRQWFQKVWIEIVAYSHQFIHV